MTASVLCERRRTVLLTGASGVLGQALLGELTDHDLIGLTHHRSVDRPGVRTVHADLTRPRLGLTVSQYAELADQVDAIVHCAAVTGFNAAPTQAESLNVLGTAQIVELAERAQATLYHLSTAFVARAPLIRGSVRPDDTATARPEVYLESKLAAERLIRDSGLPAVIVRPSVLVGDSVTGRISRFQGLHGVLGAMLKNALPLIPLLPESRVDFVPQDLVAQAVAGLVRTGSDAGDHWVTAGAGALTAGRMVDLTLRFGERLGLRLHRPRLVPPEMMDRLIRPVFIEPLPVEDRRRIDDMLALTALFRSAEPLACTLGAIAGVGPATAADLERALTTSLRYYAGVKGLLRAGGTAA